MISCLEMVLLCLLFSWCLLTSAQQAITHISSRMVSDISKGAYWRHAYVLPYLRLHQVSKKGHRFLLSWLRLRPLFFRVRRQMLDGKLRQTSRSVDFDVISIGQRVLLASRHPDVIQPREASHCSECVAVVVCAEAVGRLVVVSSLWTSFSGFPLL